MDSSSLYRSNSRSLYLHFCQYSFGVRKEKTPFTITENGRNLLYKHYKCRRCFINSRTGIFLTGVTESRSAHVNRRPYSKLQIWTSVSSIIPDESPYRLIRIFLHKGLNVDRLDCHWYYRNYIYLFEMYALPGSNTVDITVFVFFCYFCPLYYLIPYHNLIIRLSPKNT